MWVGPCTVMADWGHQSKIFYDENVQGIEMSRSIVGLRETGCPVVDACIRDEVLHIEET